MATKSLFDKLSYETSKLTTVRYSTSFSSAIKVLNKRFHEPIYNIYGFVRFADEIVDTFHDYNKAYLLETFIKETYVAIDQRISLNPILNSFQKTVHQYNINEELISTFLKSMEMDLNKKEYTSDEYKEYIVGSAEVVGLMCLKVFCEGDEALYQQLKPSAMRLGSAFQKINFLRDLCEDCNELNRVYFPNLDINQFDKTTKKEIEQDIAKDFKAGFEGILQLPKSARFGVYLAYIYYKSLFKKIINTKPERILHNRIRIPDTQKLFLLFNSYLRHNLNLL
jgi:phytoene synthase